MNDPNNAYLWKLKYDTKELGQVLTCVPHVKSQKAVHHSLNGAVYIQQVGKGSETLDLSIFVESQEYVLEIDRCNAEGRILSVYYRGTSYFGFIEDEIPEWETHQAGQYYTAKINFVVIQAVKDVIT